MKQNLVNSLIFQQYFQWILIAGFFLFLNTVKYLKDGQNAISSRNAATIPWTERSRDCKRKS